MLTEQDRTNIQNGAKEVWDAIGHDIFEALDLEKELDPHADRSAVQTLTRKDIVELILDAGRLDGYLQEQNQWTAGMKNLSLNEWVELVEPAFTFDVYGK